MKYLNSILIVMLSLAVNTTAVKAQDSTTDKNLQPVYDLDSNRYTVLKLGKQYWLKENLRTSQYNDTTAIRSGLDAAAWKATTSGAYTVYENNPANELIYGKLYNGYAVSNGKLCPKGWHIPTDAEWKELETYLGVAAEEVGRTGGRSQLAGKLKKDQHWKDAEAARNNETDFSVMPAGTRNDYGDFITVGQFAGFWTSTTYETADNYLWYRHLYYNTNEIGRNYVIKNNGYSCRCIKDKEPVKAAAKQPAAKTPANTPAKTPAKTPVRKTVKLPGKS